MCSLLLLINRLRLFLIFLFLISIIFLNCWGVLSIVILIITIFRLRFCIVLPWMIIINCFRSWFFSTRIYIIFSCGGICIRIVFSLILSIILSVILGLISCLIIIWLLTIHMFLMTHTLVLVVVLTDLQTLWFKIMVRSFSSHIILSSLLSILLIDFSFIF